MISGQEAIAGSVVRSIHVHGVFPDRVLDRLATGDRTFGAVEDRIENVGGVEGAAVGVGSRAADDRVQDERVDVRAGHGQPPPVSFSFAQTGVDGVEHVRDDLYLDPIAVIAGHGDHPRTARRTRTARSAAP